MLSLFLRLPLYFLVLSIATRVLGADIRVPFALVVATGELVALVARLRRPKATAMDDVVTVNDVDGKLHRRFREIAASGGHYDVKRSAARVEVKPGSRRRVSAEIFVPRGGGDPRRIALVCSHPWAVMGGDMTNNVPAYLATNFARLGFTTVKFNFRGGTFSRGNAEIEDVQAVCRHLESLEHPPTSVYLLGYSYGSMISNACIDTIDIVKGFVGISTCVSSPCVVWFRAGGRTATGWLAGLFVLAPSIPTCLPTNQPANQPTNQPCLRVGKVLVLTVHVLFASWF